MMAGSQSCEIVADVVLACWRLSVALVCFEPPVKVVIVLHGVRPSRYSMRQW